MAGSTGSTPTAVKNKIRAWRNTKAKQRRASMASWGSDADIPF